MSIVSLHRGGEASVMDFPVEFVELLIRQIAESGHERVAQQE
jgi:hypothetical protein